MQKMYIFTPLCSIQRCITVFFLFSPRFYVFNVFFKILSTFLKNVYWKFCQKLWNRWNESRDHRSHYFYSERHFQRCSVV